MVSFASVCCRIHLLVHHLSFSFSTSCIRVPVPFIQLKFNIIISLAACPIFLLFSLLLWFLFIVLDLRYGNWNVALPCCYSVHELNEEQGKAYWKTPSTPRQGHKIQQTPQQLPLILTKLNKKLQVTWAGYRLPIYGFV